MAGFLGKWQLSDGDVERFVERQLCLKGAKSADRKLLLAAFVQSTSVSTSMFTALTLLFFVALVLFAKSEFSTGLLVLVFGTLAFAYLAFLESKRRDAAVRLFSKN